MININYNINMKLEKQNSNSNEQLPVLLEAFTRSIITQQTYVNAGNFVKMFVFSYESKNFIHEEAMHIHGLVLFFGFSYVIILLRPNIPEFCS